MNPRWRRALLGVAAGWALLGAGSGTPVLDRFYAGTTSLSGHFEQRVADAGGKIIQRSSGKFWLQRPGLFRWDYEQPYEQRIVADGARLWVYEPDLDQVTVRALSASGGDLPGLLLSGREFPADQFVVRQAALGDDGWVEMDALRPETGISAVRIRFAGGVPAELELKDGLGQTTALRFMAVQHNAKMPVGTFRFTPPAGVDVVGDPET